MLDTASESFPPSPASGSMSLGSRADLRPSTMIFRALSMDGSAGRFAYRSPSSPIFAFCQAVAGIATVFMPPPASFGRGRLSIAAVCVSHTSEKIAASSGAFWSLAKRVVCLKPEPVTSTSTAVVVSPKFAAQASKCSMRLSFRASGWRYRCIV